MAQSTLTQVEELEKLYRLADAGKVRAYLGEHPGIVDFLLEARPHIEAQFGKEVVVVVRLPRHDDWESAGELWVKIQSDLAVDAALDRFDKLWNRWWGEASGRPESFPLYVGIEHPSKLGR